jgi:phosphoribosylanthranilate isomerase
MTIVKICGITNIEDASGAVEAGADMLGFVFADSPRRVSPSDAARITAVARGKTLLAGVFVNESQARIRETARACRLDYVQLHGDEDIEYCRSLGVPYIKAFRASDGGVLDEIEKSAPEIFVLDSFQPDKMGGTGKGFDLKIASKAAALGRMILAGGLSVENIERTVSAVRPYGVDVSTGVEIAPGRKDHEKVRRFIALAKGIPCE